ncbi:hemerythrin domain-containing protein [Jannaschia sp. Os4]|uniref:hemerythrin domain-containing protein n=1 Tax=Jannaschia sp. Os4 TaxID=2807617 RepID=UPI0019396546|nr:hemerythrin domain-containing protein [Jannaschia sp. Os4]MBM2575261.1 hemerythrin domain-containing protein [Jannaschia sp. Os4]
MTDDLNLATRTGLPPALRTLLVAHPRDGWAAHPEFGPLTRFWLERHLGFRRLLDALTADARARADGALDPRDHAVRLQRLGGAFLHGLEEHHGVEDHHYFPRLAALAPSLERGFALLDADHHRLHEELEGLAGAANAVLRGGAAGSLAERLEGMGRFLDRHLTDEEEVVVPVLLEVGEGAVG